MYSPLEQFMVLPISLDIVYNGLSLNTWAIYTLPVIIIVRVAVLNFNSSILFKKLPSVGYRLLTTLWSSISTYIYTSGSLFSMFFILIFILILFYISASNLLGLIPWGFTLTSHLVTALTIAAVGFFWLNIIFIFRFNFAAASIFLPGGTPFAIVLIIIPIEILSYCSRVLSLSIRLFANMMSGHTLLHILAGFMFSALTFNWVLIAPLSIVHLISFVEVGVACLQVYVFLTLLNLYVADTLGLNSH